MKLELNRDDLKPGCEKVNCSRTRFRDFVEVAQQAIQIVGKATFYEDDRSNYNVIYPERKENA